MASSGKTDHLQLNYWSQSDSPKMNDFNEDNRRLDEFAGRVPTREQLVPHLIYPAECCYQDGAFYLNGLPEGLPKVFTVRFMAPADYGENQEFHIGEHRLIPCTCDFSPLPDEAFKAMAIVCFEADMEGGRAFFRYGGTMEGEGGQDDSSVQEASCIFYGEVPPEDEPDGLFVYLQKPVNEVVFTPCMKRKGECDRRFSFQMPVGRYSFTPFLYKGRLYCIGGRNGSSVYNTVYILDIMSREWSIGRNVPVNIADYMLGVIGNKAYVIGGRTPNSNKTIYSYDMDNDQWKEEETLASEITSLYFSGSVVVEGIIYLFFGVRNGASSASQSYALDPQTFLMTELATNPNGSTWVQAVEKNGVIYVVGRTSTVSSNKAGLFAYHIGSNLWTTLFSDSQNRSYMGICLVGSLIYMFGGLRNAAFGTTPMDDIRAYDIESELWCDFGRFLQRRHGMGAVAGQEGIYCVGGGISTAQISGEGLSSIDILWSEDDIYPSGTLVVEYGIPTQNVPLYEARLGRSGQTDLVLSIRRVFYSEGGVMQEVPCMVRRNGSEWREVVV